LNFYHKTLPARRVIRKKNKQENWAETMGSSPHSEIRQDKQQQPFAKTPFPSER
jgi:hypothetical protein